MRVNIDHPVRGSVPQIGLPCNLAASPASIRRRRLSWGEHSYEILRELGYDEEAITALLVS